MKSPSRFARTLIASMVSLLLIVSFSPAVFAAEGDPSADASLASLGSTQALSPAFAPSTFAYTVSLPATAGSVTLTPAAAAGATFTIDGEAIAAKTYTLGYGESATATIAVTAEDTTTIATYTVAITRAALGPTRLLSPGISAGTLSPEFDPFTTCYKLTLPEGTPSVTFTPVKSVASDKLSINGRQRASYTVTLKNGHSAKVAIRVETPTHVKRIYTFRVYREKSTNADLKLLGVNVSAELSPAFNPTVTAYTMTVPEYRHSIVVRAKAAGPYATVTIDGKRCAAREIKVSHIAAKTVTITVKAQAGNTKTYTITLAQAPHIRSFRACPADVKPAVKPLQFRYALEGASDKTVLEIYASGAWRQLMARADTAGDKRFTWDGTLGGSPVAPGNYKVRLSASYGGLAASPRTISVHVK